MGRQVLNRFFCYIDYEISAYRRKQTDYGGSSRREVHSKTSQRPKGQEHVEKRHQFQVRSIIR
jgi:hypothetical protein